MLVLVKANIVAVGLGGRSNVLKTLPIRVSSVANSKQAERSLKNENVDGIISSWNLPDAQDGKFLKKLRLAKPYLPIVALIEAGNIEQEIAARSGGMTAVLSKDMPDEFLKQVIRAVLKLGDVGVIEEICASADDENRHRL